MPRIYLLYFLFLLAASTVQAGIVRGRITNPNGEGLAFANVAVRATSSSTATNEQGNYQLRLNPGRYELVFQYVGYRPHTETVQVAGGDTATVLNVILKSESYQLNEVVVRATDRDPAYAIVQQAIQWRRYHQREVAAFKARVYIKALGRLTDVPGKILGLVKVGPDLKPGIFYLSESVSEMTFQQPNVVRERMISSRVSGDSKGISFNRAGSGRDLNFYNNVVNSGFSERRFVSPIAANALFYYKYELTGSSQQGGVLVHKIRVIPKRRNDPVFSGYIYIVDGTWRLHSLALDLTKDAQLDYLDSFHLEQIFAPAPGPSDVWVMQSQKATLALSGLGFKGNGYITAVLSNYQVTPTFLNRPAPAAQPTTPTTQPTAPIAMPEPVADAKKPKPSLRGLGKQVRKGIRRAEQDSLSSNSIGLRRGEVMRVDKGVNERDSSYWTEVRPIPLTDEEKVDYHVKDSTETIRNSRAYQDSLDRKRNEFEPQKLLMGGYTYSNTFRKQQWYVAPIFNILQYNTVEGVVANPHATYTQDTDDRRTFSITPTVRYGFANKLLSPSLVATWQHDPVKIARVTLSAGRTIENFDRASQLTPFINTVYTLLDNRNYAKYYRRDGATVSYNREVVNGLTLQGLLSYYDRRELQNATIDLLRDVSGRAFTPNQPYNEELPSTSFGRNQALTFELTGSFTPGQRYITRPTGKYNFRSKYPTLRFTYRQGIPDVLGSDVRYTLLAAGLNQNISMGLLGNGSYNVAVGGFLGQPRLSFMDYRHFSGNQTLFASNFGQFQLLDYYRFSTRQRYIEAHYNQHFNGFFLNNIPLLRRLKWQEVASFNYLHTPQAGHYVELGVGIEHIFTLLRVDFFTALQSGRKLDSGFRIGLGF
ncbi:DUF5686 and carboxypeptidase regulatory-like domain-containing protein [Hymenobacter sp. GOD-10R]|uniref:DUF5686 and carboxypeptidase regulatory-like domain-containing protein n=1 Tax=Hymenobacter sp. GOD-10R TaxID=3093922 RepID=UPI002D77B0EC|nr:DUF5686 and carboxypeptidase regulatory-like domain-containing protein [Hymenobacter sp. GOD-10R]WRQ27877.1 DUF5686 and carboxypeptidase regulatory-like domain-containing protein [Hymenobacter sp. GOD-10R]